MLCLFFGRSSLPLKRKGVKKYVAVGDFAMVRIGGEFLSGTSERQ
jgi:hypothetical protein